MKKIFSNYYKIILSVVILIVLVALGEDYYTFDEMSGIWQVVRVLLYITWGFLLATRTRRDKVKTVEYVAFAVVCVAALNLLIPIWKFQRQIVKDFFIKFTKNLKKVSEAPYGS